MTRTRTPGYLRDIRRLTVALSRARLGLYILGRRNIFESSSELLQAFELPLERPENLMLTTGEMFPASRLLTDEVEGIEMEGVEHLGQYVFEMTQAKLGMLNKGKNGLPTQEPGVGAGAGAGALGKDEMDGEVGEVKVDEGEGPDEPDKSELDEIT